MWPNFAKAVCGSCDAQLPRNVSKPKFTGELISDTDNDVQWVSRVTESVLLFNVFPLQK